MHKLLIITVFLLTASFVVSSLVTAAPSPRATAPISEFTAETFIDYKLPSHSGPGPHPSTESSDFQLTQGGISWFSSSTPAKYQIIDSPSGGNTAIESAVATWDGFITIRDFSHDNSDPSNNPCGGVNTVQWASIDGSTDESGEILAMASVCRNVATKEIVGFVITMDSAESWATATDGSLDKFDVENVVSHEFGHVAGLGHTNPPKSGCLTMYTYSGLGEIQKRTLGLGDKLGMNVLYSSSDTSAGPGCGL